MELLGKILRFPFWCLSKVLLGIFLLFSGKDGKNILSRIGWSNWLRLFLAQRVLRKNSHVPWPCHPTSIVLGVKNIHLTTFPPFPGLGPGQYIQATNGIRFGANNRLGPGVKIISANHDPLDFEKHLPAEPIVLSDNCWVGANAVILPGVKLGNHVLVAAGSVVASSFEEDDILLAGVPAKVVKHLDPYEGEIPDNTIYLENNK